jgi:hypothetical protein
VTLCDVSKGDVAIVTSPGDVTMLKRIKLIKVTIIRVPLISDFTKYTSACAIALNVMCEEG